VGAVVLSNVVKLAFESLETVSIRLTLADSSMVSVSGTDVSLGAIGEAGYVEALPDDMDQMTANSSPNQTAERRRGSIRGVVIAASYFSRQAEPGCSRCNSPR
jgi:hypothetical protein